MTTDRPTTLLAELTHRCPLRCPYCSNPLDLIRAEAELGTDDWKRVFTEARALGVLQLGLSGGEPLVRKDLEELAAHARGLGPLQHAGHLGARAHPAAGRAASRRRARAHPDLDPGRRHRDAPSGSPGCSSVKQKRAAAAIVRELGFAFTVNVVLHRANLDRIGEIIDLAASLGADRLELANTQYYGWGLENRAALMPTQEQVDPRADDRRRRRSPATGGRCRSSSCSPTTSSSIPSPATAAGASSTWWWRPTARCCPVTARPRSPR